MSTGNNSGWGCLPIVGLTTIVAVGGVGAYYYFQRDLPFLPSQEITPLAAAEVIPESAFASGYLSTSDRAWKQLSEYGTSEAKQEFQDSIDQWEQETFSNNNISLEKDVLPWIDGVTFALLPPRETAAVTEGLQPLLVIGVKNKIKALQFMEKLEKEAGFEPITRDYQKITITTTSNESGDSFSFAVLDDRLVVADQEDTIETAIDTFKGSSSYADKPGVKEVLTKPLTVKNSLLTIYIPSYGETIKQFLENTDETLPKTTLKQLEQLKSVVVGIGAEKQGFHIQAIAEYNLDFIDSIPPTVEGNILSDFPGKTFVSANGQGIDQGWQELVTASAEDDSLATIVREIRNGFQQLNLDAERDFFNWMDGEFALGIIQLERGGIANLGVGGMMSLETSDRTTGNKTLEKLNQFAQETGNVTIDQRDINGTQVTEWSVPVQGVVFSYGWLNNQNLAVTLGTSFEIIQKEKEQESLPNNPQFKNIKSALPSDNLGYFYVNFSQIFQQLNALPGSPIPEENKAVLESIEGLGMTATFPNKSSSKLDLILSIKSEK
ncbi:MAG: DUF3352 domain-containing protein [Crocosphaera sp.]|nr:DUF3352 domain-containing protein [Crocosphaera sp.]